MIITPDQTTRESLEAYRRQGGYRGLTDALAHEPAWAIAQVDQAGVRGRGGSGVGTPVADKWRKVARAQHITRYVVGNGAESSPVSLKDRHLMRLFPHRVLEGLLIAARALGATAGYLYVRGDDAEALDAMQTAVEDAAAAGLFGPGTPLDLTVEVQAAIASYISGEETAVIDALEGLEGLPQPKPPRPEEIGLRGCPTALNNVETLAAVAAALRDGVDAFRATGTRDCPGTALFTVTGDGVQRPGVYELPYGTPLAELLRRAGAPAPADLLAVLPGGFSSGPLRPDELDLPLTYEDLAAAGTTLGPAAIVVLGRGDGDLLTVATDAVAFLADASCGQCRGCKEGHRSLLAALLARDLDGAREHASVLQYGRGNCAHPTGTARMVLRTLQIVQR